MRSPVRLNWKQVSASAASGLARLSASEQTRLTWARRIETFADVPEAFKGFFEGLRAAGRDFPYTVFAPSWEGFLFLQTSEKLIADLGSELVVLERNGSTYDAVCFPLGSITFLEVRTVLLDSRLRISGVSEQGAPISAALRFNSVTDYLFAPILEKIRLAGGGPGIVQTASPVERFDHWTKTGFKFRNFARQSLLEGENVLQSILQPEIRASRLTVLGKTFYTTLAPALACILTDREMILIRDDMRQVQVGSTRYGGIWNYIPLRKILGLSLAERKAGLLALAVELPAGVWLEYLFEASRRPELDDMLSLAKGLLML